MTGFACTWYYRNTLRESARHLWIRGILPTLGGLMMYAALGYSFYLYWKVTTTTSWTLPFSPHWRIGGVDIIDFITILVGIVLMVVYARLRPAFFRGQVLNRTTPTMVPDEGSAVGLFGVDTAHPSPETAGLSAATHVPTTEPQ